MTGLWLWGLSIWFFLVSVGSLWKYVLPEHRDKMSFQMTWFSFVFPNTALVRPLSSNHTLANRQTAKNTDELLMTLGHGYRTPGQSI